MRKIGDYDSWVLGNFVDSDRRLLGVPAQRKKRLAVLRWLAEDFQPGRGYPEAERNRIIGLHHNDFATLPRHLVDEELMQRRHGPYCRPCPVPHRGHDPPSRPI